MIFIFIWLVVAIIIVGLCFVSILWNLSAWLIFFTLSLVLLFLFEHFPIDLLLYSSLHALHELFADSVHFINDN